MKLLKKIMGVKQMSLNTNNWKDFLIENIFDIYTGTDLILGTIENGTIPIASNKVENNNIAAYTNLIEGRKLFDHTKSISIADRGKFWAFIQPTDFYLGTRVKGLVCKKGVDLTKNQLAFIVTIINQESFKFSYGRNCCDKLPKIKFKLPIQHNEDGTPKIDLTYKYSNEGFIPDWNFMENFIKTLNYKPITTSNKKGNEQKLNVDDWSDFLLKDIFGKAIRGTRITTLDRIEGNIPFITAGESNQGVSELISNKEAITYNNAITIDMFGNAFYHNYDFKCDDNILVMKNEYLNSYVGNFIASILCKDKYRYSYGRQYRQSDYNTHTISLPIQHNEDGTPKIDLTYKYSNEGFIPDWNFMEEYIKSLPYGDRI